MVFEMQNLSNKTLDQPSGSMASDYISNCPQWWNLGGLYIPHSSNSKSFNMQRETLVQQANQVKKLGLHLRDQDSSSTQSTGQSHQVASLSGGSILDQRVSAHSGNDNNIEKQVNVHMKPVMSLGTSVIFPSSKVDSSQPIACIPYPYTDPYREGGLAAYGSHAIVHPQMMEIASATRAPLPLEPAVDEPIYVNPKQYRAILRRRQLRAKQEAQNKLPKARKPYLHESRHLHAMKRVRGTGGRFLSMTQLQEQPKPIAPADGQKSTDPSALQLYGHGGGILGSELFFGQRDPTGTSSTPTSSEITSVSDEGIPFQQQDQVSFSTDLHSHVMRLNMNK